METNEQRGVRQSHSPVLFELIKTKAISYILFLVHTAPKPRQIRSSRLYFFACYRLAPNTNDFRKFPPTRGGCVQLLLDTASPCFI